MMTSDKAKNIAPKAKGTVKESVGKAIGNDTVYSNGKADQMKGDLKQASEKVMDGVKN